MFTTKVKRVLAVLVIVLQLALIIPMNSGVAYADENSDIQAETIALPISEETDGTEAPKEEPIVTQEENISIPISEDINIDESTKDESDIFKEDTVQAEPAIGSDTAPKDYIGDNTFLDVPGRRLMRMAEAGAAGKKVLLIEDRNPWNSTANQIVLGGLTEYKKVTTASFLEEDLSEYAVIVFANDQSFDTYTNYTAFKEYLELFASIGGVIVFGACDAGWAGGQLNEAIPGDVTKKNHYEMYNYIADVDHPIVTGELTSNDILLDADLASMFCSHISFNEDTLPPGTNVILRDQTENRPTLVEYPLGKGRVIATGLTWEHNFNYRGETIDGLVVGDFAKALDDLFAYAIRISNIDVEELHLLKEWRIKKNAHAIIVADGSTQNGEFAPIIGAKVSVDGKEYLTDDNGQVIYVEGYGLHTVSVSAVGYRERKLFYDVRERSSKIFLLDKEKYDGLPYITQIQGVRNLSKMPLDLRDHAINFTESKNDMVSIVTDGNWNAHIISSYILYQDPVGAEQGKYISSGNGLFVFSPGIVFKADRPVKLKMVAQDGVQSEPITIRLIIDKAPPVNGEGGNNTIKEGISQFDWIGQHAVQSDEDIFKKILSKDMSISSELIPIEFAIEHNDDGTKTYKGIIGFVSGEGTANILHSKKEEKNFEIDSAWDTLKKEIKGYKRAGNLKAYYENLKRKYGRDWHATKFRATVDVEINACGFIEVKVDQRGNKITADSGLIINGSGDLTIGQTFMAGSIPIYYEAKFGAGAELKGGIEFYNVNDGGLGFRPIFEGLTVEVPHVSLEGGMGVRGVATVGLQGSGKLEVEFQPNGDTSGTLEFGGAIHAKVIFVVDFKWDFWNTSIPLWPTSPQIARSFSLTQFSAKDTEISLTSRDYLTDSTPWNGGSARRLAMGAVEADPMIQTLQNGVMPDALPQIQKVGDQLVLLFLRDVPERVVGNHTQLVYSVYDGITWSEPVAVWESDTADFFFKSVVVNDKLYVAWQKLKAAPTKDTPEELLAEVAGKSEICFAVWNSDANKFEHQSFITDDNRLDSNPVIAVNGDTPTVVWVTNSENDPTGATGNFIIKSISISKDGVSNGKELLTTTDFITEIAACYTNSKLQIMYTTLEDNPEQSNVYYLNGNNSIKVDSGYESASLQFDSGMFLWQSKGVIYQYNPVTGEPSKVIAGERTPVSSSYKYVRNGTKTALVWVENDDTGKGTSIVKASILIDGKWSNPIILLDNINLNVTFMDVELQNNGEFVIVMNTLTFNEEDEKAHTSLSYVKVPPRNDIELLSVIAEKAKTAENEQPVVITMVNRGDSLITSAELAIYSGEILKKYEDLTLSLYPGEEISITENIDISAIDKIIDATVSVNAENESDTSNNSKVITLGHVDISLALNAYDLGDSLIFALQASNESKTMAHCAISLIEDSPDGIVLEVNNIGEVTNSNNVLYLYEINKSQVVFDEFNRKVYFLKLESLEEDWNPEDNQLSYVMTGMPDESNVNPEGMMEEFVIIPATTVDISKDSLNFDSVKADKVQLSATIEPANASTQYVEWSVENADIAHVDSTGLVTPLRPGVTTLTAKVSEDIIDTIPLSVGESSEPLETYTISWVDGNGNIIYSEEVLYDTVPVYRSTTYGIPSKKATTQYTYTFTGWNPMPVKVTGKAVYTAQFSSTAIVPSGGTGNIVGGNVSQSIDNPPRIKDSDITGWEAITKELQRSQKDTIILMNDSNVISKEFFETIKGKNINITFVLKNNWEWLINGNNLLNKPEDFVIGNADISINMKSVNIKESLYAGYDKNCYTLFAISDQCTNSYDWTIRVAFAKNMSGKYANLFYYDKQTDQLMLVDASVVDNDGYAKLRPSETTDYVILISEKILLDKMLDAVKVTPQSKTLYINGTTGKSSTLKVKLPEVIKTLASDKLYNISVGFESSNTKVATVSMSGKVTAKKAGKTTIVTTMTINGEVLTFKSVITVKKAYILLNKTKSKMKVGDTFTFKAQGYGFSSKDINFTTSTKSVLFIDKTTGKSVAKSKGKSYVIAKAGKATVRFKVVIN